MTNHPYRIGTKIPNYGEIVAIRADDSGENRYYLLLGENDTTTWLIESAIDTILLGIRDE